MSRSEAPSNPEGAKTPSPRTHAQARTSPVERSLDSALASLAEGFAEGNRVSLARTISVVENERPGFQSLLHHVLIEGTSGGARLGITGPPGAGKSSLVTALARRYLDRGYEVGVVAVDPSSPYSGGALLGDRIRMNELSTDPGIFIRSMASRGSLGGLAATTKEVLDVLDAFGFHRILVETVGVGQTELEITGAADSVVVVLVPESGDGIQAMKAGLMEIADIFVVNKADRPGADRLVKEIRSALHLRTGGHRGSGGHHEPAGHHGPLGDQGLVRHPGVREGEGAGSDAGEGEGQPPWTPPVLLTIAHAGEGVAELLEAVEEHRVWLLASGELERRRRERTATRIRDILDRELRRRVRRVLAVDDTLDTALEVIRTGGGTPYSAAEQVLECMGLEPNTEFLLRGTE